MKYLIILLIFITSCTSESNVINENTSDRIKIKETRLIKGYYFIIIEVDGIEYIAQDQGGIIELKK